MKKTLLRLLCLVLCAAALAGAALLPVHASGQDYIAAVHTRNTGSPYYIMVNRAMNTVTVYKLGASGYYDVPCKAMICSTGRSGHATPLGNYTVTDWRKPWCHMLDGTYGQYAVQFNGQVLFHSVCYARQDPAALIAEEYNMLGSFASLGCVRLQTADAKWIYDNCPAGTKVTVYNGTSAGALGKPRTQVPQITPELDNGWDPTDPRAENPWNRRLPFRDVPLSRWYYDSVEYVYENGVMRGTAEDLFQPDGQVTWPAALQILYNLADGSETGQPWYAPALAWAGARGLTGGMPQDAAVLDLPISRQEFAVLMYRFAGLSQPHTPSDPAPLSGYADSSDVLPSAEEAMAWAVERGLLRGTAEGRLLPRSAMSRAEMAAILCRYLAG